MKNVVTVVESCCLWGCRSALTVVLETHDHEPIRVGLGPHVHLCLKPRSHLYCIAGLSHIEWMGVICSGYFSQFQHTEWYLFCNSRPLRGGLSGPLGAVLPCCLARAGPGLILLLLMALCIAFRCHTLFTTYQCRLCVRSWWVSVRSDVVDVQQWIGPLSDMMMVILVLVLLSSHCSFVFCLPLFQVAVQMTWGC